MDNGNINYSFNSTPNSLGALEVALKGLSMRSEAIANNVANVNTKNYKRQYVDFENILEQHINGEDTNALSITDTKHYKLGATSMGEVMDGLEKETDSNTEFGLNTSNVDLDAEFIDLTKTTMKYKALSKMAMKQFQQMNSIIGGGS